MCAYWVERSAALATALAPQIGYAKAAELSKQSVKEGILIRDLVKRDKILPPDEVDEVLDLRKMTEIGVPGGTHGGVGRRLIPVVTEAQARADRCPRPGLDWQSCASPRWPNTASSARCISRVGAPKGRSRGARSPTSSGCRADYVEQILLRLRRAGIVRSTRGARGGYALARPAGRDLDSRRDRGVGDDDVRPALRVASGG